MTMPANTDPTGRSLRSLWGKLHPSLLASFYPVTPQGYRDGGPSVEAPLTEGSIELAANWQSPFEQSGPESRAPALMNMLQAGTLESFATTLLGKGDEGSYTGRIAQEITEFSRSGQGRSGMTKLNSTQLFAGAPPVKLTLTARFRAFEDPQAEVHAPIDQLAKWVLSRSLAPSGTLVSAIQAFKNGQGFLSTLLPSEAPQLIGWSYGGYSLSPVVIESMSHPIVGPRSEQGLLNVAVQLQLSTLTALDAGDWDRMRSGQPIRLFNNQ